MRQIRTAVRSMIHLSDPVLRSARLEAGELRTRLRRTNLHALIDEAVSELREAHDHAVFDVSLAELPLEADLDPTLVQQAIHNILSNAVKFSPGSPRVAVRACFTSGLATIAISDNGIGIAEDDVPRGVSALLPIQGSPGIAGTGLGLSIARDICMAATSPWRASATRARP